MLNPSPGTVLDISVVYEEGQRLFEFFMISHEVNEATAYPVHYNAVHNIHYIYVNFVGSIKVPSVCMYAKKDSQIHLQLR